MGIFGNLLCDMITNQPMFANKVSLENDLRWLLELNPEKLPPETNRINIGHF